jgi:hypothetical protein
MKDVNLQNYVLESQYLLVSSSAASTTIVAGYARNFPISLLGSFQGRVILFFQTLGISKLKLKKKRKKERAES